MNPKLLEKQTRSALRATFLYFFDHPTEHQMDQYAELILPDLLARFQYMATCDELDDYMRRGIYEVVEEFHTRCVVCGLVEE